MEYKYNVTNLHIVCINLTFYTHWYYFLSIKFNYTFRINIYYYASKSPSLLTIWSRPRYPSLPPNSITHILFTNTHSFHNTLYYISHHLFGLPFIMHSFYKAYWFCLFSVYSLSFCLLLKTQAPILTLIYLCLLL